MRKKFRLPHEIYEKVFNVKVDKVRKIAVCGFSYQSNGLRGSDIEVKTVREFIYEICEELSAIDYMRQSIPESYPLLRAIQMSAWATKKPRAGRRH